jgi:hypothetical protein
MSECDDSKKEYKDSKKEDKDSNKGEYGRLYILHTNDTTGKWISRNIQNISLLYCKFGIVTKHNPNGIYIATHFQSLKNTFRIGPELSTILVNTYLNRRMSITRGSESFITIDAKNIVLDSINNGDSTRLITSITAILNHPIFSNSNNIQDIINNSSNIESLNNRY